MAERPLLTEAERQQALWRTLSHAPGAADPALWQAPQAGWLRGLQVYQANAGAAAERALAAAFPTVAALIGAASMAGLARAYWHARPPQRGDLGELGDALPGFIADSPSLADEPYLADVARLDWRLHQAERAADAPEELSGLQRLGDTDPARLWLRLAPGTAVLRSRWPIVTLWQAHQWSHQNAADAPPDRFAAARAALAAGQGETALVWRQGWRARVAALPPAQADFTEALLARQALTGALDAAPDLDFAAWLGEAVQQGWLVAVEAAPAEEEPT